MRIRLPVFALSLGVGGLFFFPGLPGAFALPIPQISTGISPVRVVLGEEALFTVTAAWTGPPSEFTFSTPVSPECRGVTVTGTTQRSIVYRKDGEEHQVREFLFSLKGESAGPGRIGPVRLLYRRRDENEDHPLTTEPMEIEIASGAPGPVSLKSLLFIMGALALVLVITVYVRWTIRRYKKQSNEVIADYVKNLETESLQELDGVRKFKIRGDIEGYLERIWKILADYLEKKYTITISPDTWNEVLGGARSPELSGESGAELARILKMLEESRFGSRQAESRELDDILKRVYTFIESQKVEARNTK